MCDQSELLKFDVCPSVPRDTPEARRRFLLEDPPRFASRDLASQLMAEQAELEPIGIAS